jgi:hypothetical protein
VLSFAASSSPRWNTFGCEVLDGSPILHSRLAALPLRGRFNLLPKCNDVSRVGAV